MTNEKVKERLSRLIYERKGLIITTTDAEHIEIYKEDVEALKAAIEAIDLIMETFEEPKEEQTTTAPDNVNHPPHYLAAQIMQHYGTEHQKDIFVEECAELIQAVEKSRRGILAEDKPAYTYDMISEMADVQIMLWQFENIMTAYARQCYKDEIYRKLRRQIERIEEERR